MAPPLHYWYAQPPLLNQSTDSPQVDADRDCCCRYGFLMRKIPGTTPVAVLSRLALDQFAFAPLFVTLVLSTVTVMDGKPSEVRNKLDQDLFSTIKANWEIGRAHV